MKYFDAEGNEIDIDPDNPQLDRSAYSIKI